MLFKILFKYISMFLIAIIPYFHSLLKVEEGKKIETKTDESNSIAMQHKNTRMKWHDSIQLINK